MNDSVQAQNLAGVLVQTKTEFERYEITDSQVSNTSSLQDEFVSGLQSAPTF
jgi:hypothetical protein